MKKIKLAICLLTLLIALAGIALFWVLDRINAHIVFSAPELEAHEATLDWDNSLNLEQSHNACGPYSTMAYIFLESGVVIEPEKINTEIGGRHGDGLTYPWGITEYLINYGIKAHSYYLGLLNGDQKIQWIKSRIDQGRPVIVAVGNAEWGHYMTILGYKNNIFYKYDSYLSEDLNGENPGNSDAEEQSIVSGIEGLKFHGFSPNLAISY